VLTGCRVQHNVVARTGPRVHSYHPWRDADEVKAWRVDDLETAVVVPFGGAKGGITATRSESKS